MDRCTKGLVISIGGSVAFWTLLLAFFYPFSSLLEALALFSVHCVVSAAWGSAVGKWSTSRGD